MTTWSYPPARRGPDADDHHGETVPDPYRWLEDTDGTETREWIAAENRLTESYLATVPVRPAIRARLEELWDYPRVGVPFERGGRWFQMRQDGLADQPILYVSDDPVGGGEVLLDPNGLSADGTVALTGVEVTEDGLLLAYATSAAGSDWRTWRVRDVATRRDLADVVEWSKFFPVAWRGDGSGFFYSALDRPASGAEHVAASRAPAIRFHRLGTAQADDPVVYRPSGVDWLPGPAVSDDDRYLIVTVDRGTFPETQVDVLDLDHPDGGFQTLVAGFTVEATVIGTVGSRFYVLTDHSAERRRVVAVDIAGPAAAGPIDGWDEVVAEGADTLVGARLYGGRLVLPYLHDVASRLEVVELDGRPVRTIPVPGLAALAGSPLGDGTEGRASSSTVHFALTSFADPGSLWRHDVATGETTMVRPSAARVDPSAFVTEQVFAPSEDGTPVPMFLTRRRDVRPGGDVPVLLYGYGGFNVSITPYFSLSHYVWMERGGLLAVANLRGGGEYGRAWHDGGRRADKHHVFEDFAGCADWLAGSGWSRPDRIAISGGSNGGLLVGASITQPSRAVRRRGGPGRGLRHAALRPLHHRLGVGERLRRRRRCRAVPVAAELFTPPQRAARD